MLSFCRLTMGNSTTAVPMLAIAVMTSNNAPYRPDCPTVAARSTDDKEPPTLSGDPTDGPGLGRGPYQQPYRRARSARPAPTASRPSSRPPATAVTAAQPPPRPGRTPPAPSAPATAAASTVIRQPTRCE